MRFDGAVAVALESDGFGVVVARTVIAVGGIDIAVAGIGVAVGVAPHVVVLQISTTERDRKSVPSFPNKRG